MVGLMQVMIYLLCVYLIFKGVEIFQIAFVSNNQTWMRPVGIVLGVVMTAGAVVVAVSAFLTTESMVANIGDKMNSIPKFP